MGYIAFILKKLKTADLGGIKKTAQEVAAVTGRSWPSIYLDILNCTRRHGSGRVDYISFKMYDMNEEERAKILTIGRNNELVKRFNNLEYSSYFDDKALFNQTFDKYLKRDWMILDGENFQEFADFFREKESLFIKPLDKSCGEGIEKLVYDQEVDIRGIYERLVLEGKLLAEEVIVQDGKMASLCSTSVNTVRLITVLNGGKPYLVAGAVRMGREGNIVDNFDFGGYGADIGGFAATLDVDRGVIITPAIDKRRDVYEEKVTGFEIPRWNEIVEMVLEASKVVPQMGYIGWDVAISQKRGPLLVEGNNFPAQDFIQVPELRIGTYETLMKKINGQ